MLHPSSECPRHMLTQCVGAGDSLVLISGRTSPTRPLNDVWMLHLPTMVWTPTTTTVVGAEHDEGVLEGVRCDGESIQAGGRRDGESVRFPCMVLAPITTVVFGKEHDEGVLEGVRCDGESVQAGGRRD
eukprot:1144595-Pelagomonas_calceolata.AAC.1